MKRYKLILAITGLSLCATSQAQQAWTLRQCIDYAIEHNINIRQTANATEQNAIDVHTAKWARLPNLNGSAGQNWSWGRSASPMDNTYSDTNNGSSRFEIGTNAPLFTGFRLSNQYALSQLNLKAALEDLNKAKEDMAINIASEYLKVLLNQELSKVAATQTTLSKEQYARIARLAEVGKASPAEVSEAKARVAQDEMNAVQASNNHQLALLSLSQLLELPTPEGFILAQPDTVFTFAALTPPDDIYTEALTNKPDIRAAQIRLEGTAKSIRIEQSNFYPQLSFSAGMGTSYYTLNGEAAETFSSQLKNNLNKYVGFSLSVPLFNRFATRNRVRIARLQQTNLSLRLDETKKALYKEIQQAWYRAVAAESNFNSSLSAAEANQESFHLMSQKFDNGKATAVEYNEAKQRLEKALSDKIQSKYDYLFSTKILDFYKGQSID